jgi:hypothetical protein
MNNSQGPDASARSGRIYQRGFGVHLCRRRKAREKPSVLRRSSELVAAYTGPGLPVRECDL